MTPPADPVSPPEGNGSWPLWAGAPAAPIGALVADELLFDALVGRSRSIVRIAAEVLGRPPGDHDGLHGWLEQQAGSGWPWEVVVAVAVAGGADHQVLVDVLVSRGLSSGAVDRLLRIGGVSLGGRRRALGLSG